MTRLSLTVKLNTKIATEYPTRLHKPISADSSINGAARLVPPRSCARSGFRQVAIMLGASVRTAGGESPRYPARPLPHFLAGG
jgi:hypothetical protein